jgi:hypothetical protein
MPAYSVQATSARDATFRDKVAIALVQQAVSVQGEAKGAMTDAVYGKRQALSKLVLVNPTASTVIDTFVWGLLASDTTLDITTITDAQIQTKVAGAWNKAAGVTGAD